MIYALHFYAAGAWHVRQLDAASEGAVEAEAAPLHVALEATESRVLEIGDDGKTRVLALAEQAVAERERVRDIAIQQAVAARARREAGAADEAKAVAERETAALEEKRRALVAARDERDAKAAEVAALEVAAEPAEAKS